jgi:O-acetyl-ADP-ribose deacetylase (regulator of RNase III)
MRRIRKGLRNVFALCAAEGLEVLVMPPLPAPVGGPGPESMARLTLEVAGAWLTLREAPREVHFCCFSAADLAAYETALEGLMAEAWEKDEFPTDP